jgi:hypothetical protein
MKFLIKLVFSRYFVVIVVLASTSIKMASSSVSDLRLFVRPRDLLPGVNSGVGISQFSSYRSLDLGFLYQFWIFYHGCRNEDCVHNIFLSYYVLDNDDSYPWIPATSIKM